MEGIQKGCLVFTIVGALVWLLIGIFDFNLVEAIFGTNILERLIYIIVGICGIVNIGLLMKHFD